jgi:hypothetical protein
MRGALTGRTHINESFVTKQRPAAYHAAESPDPADHSGRVLEGVLNGQMQKQVFTSESERLAPVDRLTFQSHRVLVV